MENLRIQSVVRPEKPLSFNERTELIFNEVLRSKGLTSGKPLSASKGVV